MQPIGIWYKEKRHERSTRKCLLVVFAFSQQRLSARRSLLSGGLLRGVIPTALQFIAPMSPSTCFNALYDGAEMTVGLY